LDAVDERLGESLIVLMKRDVPHSKSGSKGSRRRSPREKQGGRAESVADGVRATSMGRPRIGSERRKNVQTSIAERTRDTLSRLKIPVTAILEACVREAVRYGY
jgi:hypothetical protein